MSSWTHYEYKVHTEYKDKKELNKGVIMDILLYVAVGTAVLVVLALLCKYCCCGAGDRGRVLAPPADPAVTATTAAYPQQQYTTAYPVAAPTSYPVGHNITVAYPTVTPAPYPTAGAPYPTAGAPYPTAGAPYPTAGAPYPTAGAPYPTAGAPYPMAGAYPNAPTAPDANAQPPSYDQVMVGGHEKQPPHNPHMNY